MEHLQTEPLQDDTSLSTPETEQVTLAHKLDYRGHEREWLELVAFSEEKAAERQEYIHAIIESAESLLATVTSAGNEQPIQRKLDNTPIVLTKLNCTGQIIVHTEVQDTALQNQGLGELRYCINTDTMDMWEIVLDQNGEDIPGVVPTEKLHEFAETLVFENGMQHSKS